MHYFISTTANCARLPLGRYSRTKQAVEDSTSIMIAVGVGTFLLIFAAFVIYAKRAIANAHMCKSDGHEL